MKEKDKQKNKNLSPLHKKEKKIRLFEKKTFKI